MFIAATEGYFARSWWIVSSIKNFFRVYFVQMFMPYVDMKRLSWISSTTLDVVECSEWIVCTINILSSPRRLLERRAF